MFPCQNISFDYFLFFRRIFVIWSFNFHNIHWSVAVEHAAFDWECFVWVVSYTVFIFLEPAQYNTRLIVVEALSRRDLSYVQIIVRINLLVQIERFLFNILWQCLIWSFNEIFLLNILPVIRAVSVIIDLNLLRVMYQWRVESPLTTSSKYFVVLILLVYFFLFHRWSFPLLHWWCLSLILSETVIRII